MSKPPSDGPSRDKTDRATFIEWKVAWLIALAAAAMLVGGLAKLVPG